MTASGPGAAGEATGVAPGDFDVCGPLPGAGVTVLEASAGTGKTFTIAALVTRFVAEGTPIGQVLAVTFTRMATGELRDRVRARLVSAEAGLSAFLEEGTPVTSADSLLELLADGGEAEVALRRDRLATALTSFDEATITTTHGFCQLMLAGLGVAGDVATGATLLEDTRDLVEEVVDDLYVRKMLRHGAPSFNRSQALELAGKAVANPVTPIVPGPEDSAADLRARFAGRARADVQRRLLENNYLTFDDLLVRLRDTLVDPHRGAAACGRLRERYSVVLVDEFQDTDPVQWEVVKAAFGQGTTLVLIGDPKQAIYAFRGADVYAYLDAARLAIQRFTLGENWRSDARLLRALDTLWDPATLGHPDITFRPVRAAPAHEDPGLRGAPVDTPLRARLVTKASGVRTNRHGLQKDGAREFIAGDLASDVVQLLASDAVLVAPATDGTQSQERPLEPGDVAVLVNTNKQAQLVLDALRAVEVPAVVAGTESVLSTPAATDWLALLEATEQPANRARAVAVALTPFVGMSGDEVAAAQETEWEAVHARLHRWSATLRQHGVAPLFRAVLAGDSVPARLLQERDGERRLTDLGHIARLLHVEMANDQLGPAALRAWLARRIEEASAGRGEEAEERSRWIDSDDDAVKVLTVHRAKGLEFPVVYCPYVWDAFARDSGGPVLFHDPDDLWRRKLDVAGSDGGADYHEHFGYQRDEERGEALRQLYVALTRAKHQVVFWWARAQHSNLSAISRLLFARDDDGTVAASSRITPSEKDMKERLEELAARASGLVAVEEAGRRGGATPSWGGRGGRSVGPLEVAAFERSLDLRWRRTSYSGITAWVHDSSVVGSDPEEPGTTDEPAAGSPAEQLDGATEGSVGPRESPGDGEPSAWSDLPAGAEMGTFVHRVLEEMDFCAQDVRAEITRAIGPAAPGSETQEGPAARLAVALEASIATPLGPLAGGMALREVARSDRLDEMGFELPLAGGDGADSEVALATGDIARLFERHLGEGPGPLAGYARRLRDPLLSTEVRGYLTGSLDLVFRTPAGAGPPRYLVVDYKTNRLGPEGAALSTWHYRAAALDDAMQRMHYPLQAAFYLVALHRYLRWRLADYDPEVHLGGVLYLFLRGMVGPGTPAVDGVPCGVFSWRPPSAFVTELSDLFEGGA